MTPVVLLSSLQTGHVRRRSRTAGVQRCGPLRGSRVVFTVSLWRLCLRVATTQLLEFLVAYLSVFYAVALREDSEIGGQQQGLSQEVSSLGAREDHKGKSKPKLRQKGSHGAGPTNATANENGLEKLAQNGLLEDSQIAGVLCLCPIESAARVALSLVQLNFR